MGIVVADACLLITFGNANVLELLENLEQHQVVAGGRASTEVIRNPAAAALQAALLRKSIRLECVDLADAAEQAALIRYDGRLECRGRGEAEVLALAVTRGYIVGSDDAAVRSTANADCAPRRCAGTVDILRWAAQEGRITVVDAVSLLTVLDIGRTILAQLARQGKAPEELF